MLNLSRQEKKDLGILPLQVLQTARELIKDGDITKDTNRNEMATILLFKTTEEYYDDWEAADLDWNDVLAYLERLLTFIVPLLLIFI